ncbi:MAG: hypothetical protein R3C39_03330 [Dehalococcoidia bacterium]
MTLETAAPIPASRALVPHRPIPRSRALIEAIRRSPWLTPLAGAGALTAGIIANHGVQLARAAMQRSEAPSVPSTSQPPVEVVQLPPEAFQGLSRLVVTNVTIIERRRSAS